MMNCFNLFSFDFNSWDVSFYCFYTVHIGFVETYGVIYFNVYFPNSEWTFDTGILFLEQNECEDKKQWLK